MGKLVLGLAAAAVIGGWVLAHQSWERTREHERQVTKKAFDALGKISPEDQAIIDEYKAMKERWNKKIKEGTNGEMDLQDVELRLALSQMGNLSH